MKILSKLRFENIDKVKLASEASQENFAFLATKYEKIAKLEHLVCPKVGGLKPTCAPPPHFWKWGGGAHAPAAPPPSPTPLLSVCLSVCDKQI